MGSLKIQPPSGLTRNLTEVFVFLRNNAKQRTFDKHSIDETDEKLALIDFDVEKGTISVHSKTPPQWVNILDEVAYEMSRIKSRKSILKDLQQKHLMRPDFSDESAHTEQEKIKDLTDEVTGMFTHARRLIRLLEEAESGRSCDYVCLKDNVISSLLVTLNDVLHEFRSAQSAYDNVISSLLVTLNDVLHEFRSAQSAYVRQLDSRRQNVDSFLLAPSSSHDPFNVYGNDPSTTDPNEELTIDQVQAIIENEHMVKEREKEVIKISKSILELNSLFKDVASLILDQGTILDRIDYNIEQSVLRVKSALTNVQKAEKYQRSRKMQCIVILAGIVIFLTLLLILTKT
uniref:t-SNARE coiled-coil homology domain-containing protein n=1 Tax=Acrobeloides nanus TaxID=290746 RepID=A0A914BYE6_9BILA